MATLEKIRSKGGVLVGIMIGFALFAFIMTDLLSSGSSIFQKSKQEVAEINGESVSIKEFQARVSEMEEYAKMNSENSSLDAEMVNRLRDQAWNQMVNEMVMGEKYEQLGINVSSAELLNMVTGSNVHPTIQQLFRNPQTGRFDQQQVINFLRRKQQDPRANFYWNFIEDQLINERLFSKYAALFQKGFHVTSNWTESEIDARKTQADFDFLRMRRNSISDEEVTVSDEEIEDYYDNNQERFKQEATRDIEYVTFDVEPTEEDRQMTEQRLKEMKDDFSDPEVDAEQFVRINSDIPFDPAYKKPAQFSNEIRDFVTSNSSGDVYGPYYDDDTYILTRLVDVAQIPDSAKARHILIRKNQQNSRQRQNPQQNSQQAQNTADSLMTELNQGADFAELARQHSEDQGSAINGGDLGWFRQGQMVKPFSDAVFFGEEGDIVQAESDFGIHIIHIQEQSEPVTKYQVAHLGREVTYSSQTYQNVYSEATKFAAQNSSVEQFNEAIEEENLTKRYGRNLNKNDREVGSLDQPRELVKWAFEAEEEGAMSPVLEFGDQFVIATLSDITEEGTVPLEEVRSRIERQLIEDKKEAILVDQLQQAKESGKTLQEIATENDVQMQSASQITFDASQVPGAGVEPALVSLAVYSSPNEVSEPVAGNNGVYLVQVTSKTELDINKEQVSKQLKNNINAKVRSQLQTTIRDNAEIEDNRVNFY